MQKKIDEIKKYCPACEQTKPVKGFYKHNKYPDGYAPRCKRCMIDKKYIPKGIKFKAKSMHLRTHEEIIDLKGVTPEDIRQSYLILQILGYNVCEDIHAQFCEKYGLNPKKRKWTKRRRSTPESFGLC